MSSFLTWAYDHSKETDPKYNTLSHSLYISLTGTALFVAICLGIRQVLFTQLPEGVALTFFAPEIGCFFLFYLLLMMGTRLYENGPIAIYEGLWACNQALLIAAFGTILNDPFYIRSAIVSISVDQLLWYIDILGYIFTKKFYIGVAKYIVWPETSKLRLSTTFHHLWFVPLCFWMVYPSFPLTSFNLEVYAFSALMSLVLAFIGRISTPKQITLRKHVKVGGEIKEENKVVYMNLNLSWELWKDVKIGFFADLYRVVPSFLTPLVLSMFWNVGNLPGFLLFCFIEYLL